MKDVVLLAMLSLILILIPSLVQAQTSIKNPTHIAFVSPDHPIATAYEVGIFLGSAAAPISTLTIGKPALDPTTQEVNATISVRAVTLGSYNVKVRAIITSLAGTPQFSEWGGGGPLGDQPIPFDRVLSLPVSLRLLP